MKRAVLAVVTVLSFFFGTPAYGTSSTDFHLDFWADNWAAVYVNGVRVAIDSVPITTVRSFNKVSANFKATYPLTVAVIAKDYVENSSGLEYIGASNQQIGDAGFILQILETKTGKVAAATNSAWKSQVLFKAPLNPECVSSKTPLTDCKSSTVTAPSGWYGTKYSDSKWGYAKQYTEEQVGVKEGYNEVNWNSQAKLIWSSSLTLDNTVLFRYRATAALTQKSFTLVAPALTNGAMLKDNSCDGTGTMPQLSWSGAPSATKYFLITMDTPAGPARPGETAQTDFNHLVLYNIPISTSTIGPNSTAGVQGKNFKGSLGYTPPCSQGPGLKTYTFHLYALSASLPTTAMTGAEALAAAKDLTLATTTLNLTYTR